MTDEHYWKAVTSHLRQQGKVTPLTQEQAEREIKTLGDEKLAVEEREQIMKRVLAGGKRPVAQAVVKEKIPIVPVCVSSSSQLEFAQLNRNKGSDTSEADETLKKLREEALTEDESGATSRMAKNKTPPTKG